MTVATFAALEYPKTDNLLARDEESHKLIRGQFRLPQFEQVNRWLVTEKIDGTNIRLILHADDDGLHFSIRGRSDNALLPKHFVEEAVPCDVGQMNQAWELLGASAQTMIVFGEGYGAGIQKGGDYSDRKRLRIFDVVTVKDGNVLWRTWEDVVAVARTLGIATVPLFGADYSTDEVIALVDGGLTSVAAWENRQLDSLLTAPPAEGVVARTDPYLYDWKGHRVMFKLKSKDLPPNDEGSS